MNPTCMTLFPYTTLFRSWSTRASHGSWSSPIRTRSAAALSFANCPGFTSTACGSCRAGAVEVKPGQFRSEEHTSELQSHSDIVCRLMLEKKKYNNLDM